MDEEWWIEKDGVKYVRVSKVISKEADFSHIPAHILKHKQQLGTNVHKGIESWVHGDFPYEIKKEENGYFESYQKWEEAVAPRYIQTERRYFDEKRLFTGAIDGLVLLEGAEHPVIIDFKTSVSESPAWRKQGHLYHHLVTETHVVIQPRILFLKLDKNGKLPKVFEYQLDKNIQNECLRMVDEFWSELKS